MALIYDGEFSAENKRLEVVSMSLLKNAYLCIMVVVRHIDVSGTKGWGGGRAVPLLQIVVDFKECRMK